MAQVLKPPTPLDDRSIRGVPSLFLAGSIAMGEAEDWQSVVEQSLSHQDMIILNPRRAEWDASWEQSISNPHFRGQVEWELTAQEMASTIAMYFAPGTQAPITLLELGLFARDDKIVVCCPDGFWRKGNVEVVCSKFNIPMTDSLDQLVAAIEQRL